MVDYVTWFSDINVYQSTGTDVLIVKPPGGKFVMYYEGVSSSATGRFLYMYIVRHFFSD